jgi:uncharacterized protein YndB with AHSA1/START domain
MTGTPTTPPLTGTITVDAPIEPTFRVFTDSFGSWWPAEYHIGQAEMATAILEPRAGGRWYEQGVDGSECDWGRVVAWEPPHRLVVTWQINGHWQYDPDPERASEIEVRFAADGPDQTIDAAITEADPALVTRSPGVRKACWRSARAADAPR